MKTLAALKTAQIAALTTAQLVALRTDQAQALATQQVFALATAQLVAVATDDFASLSTASIAAMQTEYSLWTRQAEIAVLAACQALGTTFVAFSPVGRGALADGVADPAQLVKGDLRIGMPRFSAEHWPHNAGLIAAFRAEAAALGVTPAQLSLAWVLAQGDHIVAIPGTANRAHLAENIARWDWVPDAAVLARLDALINQQTVAGGRYPPAMQRSIDTEDFAA